eukprot:s719_g12.t2
MPQGASFWAADCSVRNCTRPQLLKRLKSRSWTYLCVYAALGLLAFYLHSLWQAWDKKSRYRLKSSRRVPEIWGNLPVALECVKHSLEQLHLTIKVTGQVLRENLEQGGVPRTFSEILESVSQDAPYAIMAVALHRLDRSDLEQLLLRSRCIMGHCGAVDAYFTEHFGEDFSDTFGISNLSLQDLSQEPGRGDHALLEGGPGSQDGRTFLILARSSCCGR